MDIRTATPFMHDARRANFSLTSIKPGDVVDVTTTAGSVWTFVRTTNSRESGGFMAQVVMMTTSRNAGQITRRWTTIAPQTMIQLGEPIIFSGWYTTTGQQMHTSGVTQVCLNGVKVL